MLAGCSNNATSQNNGPDEGWDLRAGDVSGDQAATDSKQDTTAPTDARVDLVADQPHDLTDQSHDVAQDLIQDTSVDLAQDTSIDQALDLSGDLSSDMVADTSMDTSTDQGGTECSLEGFDNVCPKGCGRTEDADCCVVKGVCEYVPQSQSCACIVPGPFRAPEMTA